VSFNHIFSPILSANVGLNYSYVEGSDAIGDFLYRSVNLPMGLTWDRRDKPNDATKRFLVDVEVKPFLGFGDTEDGVRLTFDTRGYYGFGEDASFVLAARIQGGSIIGASALGAPRDQLFYSGGGGTVRGQPYQSLGIEVATPGGPVETGGTTFLGGSLEGRFKFNDTYGAVAFFDVGTVSDGGLGDGGGQMHSGAGFGLRYQTGFGPLRVDIAAPVNGSTGSGMQIYVGLGQAF
jgi:translocation and assembly module TamA